MSVTALGADAGRARTAAGQVVDYLSQRVRTRLDQAGSLGDRKPLLGQEVRAGAYYSDSGARAGRWRGAEAARLGETVEGEQLRRALLGQDPLTGEQLVAATGSSGRSRNRPVALPVGPADELFTLDRVATYCGVDVSYLRRVAARTATYRSGEASPTGGLTRAVAPTGAWLDAVKVEGQWRVSRAEIERFTAARRQPQVVIGYDVTFSAPKSLSILWATGNPETRRLCEEAFEVGVAAGVDYLERQAIWVRRGRGYEPAGGMVAASYRHDTNRELEPQLHEHVVIANMATGPDGRVQAIDGRGLFAHATTAGHLAEAAMQHHTNRRGIAWTRTHRGIANVAGVSDEAIRAVSTRREQVLSLSAELGIHTAQGRQRAALATRAAKDHGVEPADLEGRWRHRLTRAGFGPTELARATSAPPARLWTPQDSARLDAHLAGPHGVTEMAAIFDRRDVIQAIVDHTAGRLSAPEVIEHADRWLRTDAVVPLAASPFVRHETIGGAGKVALAADATYFTTPTMVAIEEAIGRAWAAGHDTGTAVVPPRLVEQAIARWETTSGLRLGEDQAAMVRGICGSGDRFQAVVGPAGSGKTAALEVAARAWEAAGYTVVGAAVNGTAAEVLARSTGIEARTVASLVTRLDTAGTPILNPRTVVIVDEASTLGNRHHARLAHHITRSGGAMRAVGDPAQHTAVEAGGMWAELVRRYPDRTPQLTENRRQTSPEMADVRLAAADYRAGRIADALARLDTNQRIVTAPTAAELFDQLAADWYVDRHHAGRPSRMMAEHHHDRRALNVRAQALLRADGTLTGPGVRIGEADFHVGDDVIARAQHRDLRPDGGDRRSYIRNGTTGRVVDIVGKAGREDLIVEFAHRGRVRVPHDWLTSEIRPGVIGGLAPGYAVTSHAAEGDTYRAGRMSASDTSQPEAVYVALTRGTNDARIYLVKAEPATIDTDPKLPRLTDQRSALEALTDQLTKPKPTDLATLADPAVANVVALTRQPLAALHQSQDPDAQRAARIVAQQLAGAAVAKPDPAIIQMVGPRATHPDQPRWDDAVAKEALYRQRWVAGSTVEALPEPGDRPPNAQVAEHRAARRALLDANAARLASTPTAELAAERRHLLSRLDDLPYPDPGFLRARVEHAQQRLDSVVDLQQTARAEHTAASTARARRRDPDAPERARRVLIDADLAVADAHHKLRQARLALDARPADLVARRAVTDRIETIDLALAPRIKSATQQPAQYLHDTLGPRAASSPHRWDSAAHAIETYRHRHLGLAPTNGPAPGGGAIGSRPNDITNARAWDTTQASISRRHGDDAHQRALRIGR